MNNRPIDTGDIILHRPTGERWVVACVRGRELSWVGWPEGVADVADCELIRKATPDERMWLLRRMAHIDGDDHRKRYAQRELTDDRLVEHRDTTGWLFSDMEVFG